MLAAVRKSEAAPRGAFPVTYLRSRRELLRFLGAADTAVLAVSLCGARASTSCEAGRRAFHAAAFDFSLSGASFAQVDNPALLAGLSSGAEGTLREGNYLILVAPRGRPFTPFWNGRAPASKNSKNKRCTATSLHLLT